MSCQLVGADAAAEFLKENNDFVILTHANPDGDTIGSGYALNAVLRAFGKRSKVLCADDLPSKFRFLLTEKDMEFSEKTVIAVDIADERLLGGLEERYKGKIDLCIDHHGSNTQYAKMLYLEADSASCCECVYNVINSLGTVITPFVASALYLGITTDTGCFKFSGTTPRTHRFAAELMELGADFDVINRVMFETKSKARLELERKVLDGIEFICGGACALVTVTREMIESTGCEQTDLDSVASLAREIEGVKIGVTVKEQSSGSFRVSVRTYEPYDASEICKRFGGGGHKRAAGCEFKVPLAEAKAALVQTISELLNPELIPVSDKFKEKI